MLTFGGVIVADESDVWPSMFRIWRFPSISWDFGGHRLLTFAIVKG